MTTLDRYISVQYLKNAAILLVILFALIITIDVSINLDRFWDIAGRELPDQGWFVRSLHTAWLVVDFWWPRALMLYGFMIGAVMIGAMGFTCAQMSRHRELVATLAGGISLQRLCVPMFVCSTGLVGLQVLNQELVLPRIAPLLIRNPGEAGLRTLKSLPVPLTPDAHGRVFFAQEYDPQREAMSDLTVIQRDSAGVGLSRMTAERGTWDGGAWEFEGVEITSTDANGQTELRREARVRLETDLGPTSLRVRQFSGYAKNLSSPVVASILFGGTQVESRVAQQLERVLYGRFSTLLGYLLSLAVTLPFFFTRVPIQLVRQCAACAPVALLTMGASVLGVAIEIPGVPTALSVCTPIIALAPAAIVAITGMKT